MLDYSRADLGPHTSYHISLDVNHNYFMRHSWFIKKRVTVLRVVPGFPKTYSCFKVVLNPKWSCSVWNRERQTEVNSQILAKLDIRVFECCLKILYIVFCPYIDKANEKY